MKHTTQAFQNAIRVVITHTDRDLADSYEFREQTTKYLPFLGKDIDEAFKRITCVNMIKAKSFGAAESNEVRHRAVMVWKDAEERVITMIQGCNDRIKFDNIFCSSQFVERCYIHGSLLASKYGNMVGVGALALALGVGFGILRGRS